MLNPSAQEEGERGCSDLLSDRRREITPVAFEDVEREIFAMASPATRCMYEICASAVDNWVIRWMLWHVIENSGPRPTPTHSHTGVTPIPSPVVEERFVTPPTSNKQVRSDSPLQGMLSGFHLMLCRGGAVIVRLTRHSSTRISASWPWAERLLGSHPVTVGFARSA